jgi:hypothetical protein
MYGFRVRKSPKPLPSAQGSSPPILGFYAYHYKGTASLLQVRQQRGYTQNVPLEKAVRRTIVSVYIRPSVHGPGLIDIFDADKSTSSFR